MKKRSISVWPFALIGIFIFSIALYLPSLMGSAIWDDTELISGHGFGGNTFLAAFTHPFLGRYFRPLTSASFVLDSTFAKQTPFIYHQTNLLLHALTAVLIACLGLLLTQSRAAGVLCGLFFAAQPLQVGTTAWIGGRTDVLSSMFLAAFMVTLLLYHQTAKPRWLVLSTFAFFLAAVSKEQALAILPAVPLSVFVFGSKKWKDAGKLCLPFGIAVLAFIGLWVIDAPAPFGVKSSAITLMTLPFRTFAHYSLAFLTPNDPSLQTYTLENYRGLSWILVGLVLAIGYLWFIKYAWKEHRPWAWLAVCALLVYIPISNFPAVPSFVVGPYRCGESGTAVACLLGIVCAEAFAAKRYLLAGALCANLAVGLVVTRWGIQQWLTPADLFRTQALIDPHFLAGVRNYGQALELQGKYDEELRRTDDTLSWLFQTNEWMNLLAREKMAAFTPDMVDRLKSNGGEADWKALGAFLSCNAGARFKLHHTADAIRVEQEAIMISGKDPRIRYAYGQLLLKTNRPEAIRQFEYALKLAPNFTGCAAALAHERLIDGRYADAVKLINPILTEMGWDSGVWLDLAKAKLGLGDFRGAEEALSGAEHAVFVKKTDIDAVRRLIARSKKPKAAAHG